ncbi:A/G-specific adenine glycosylase [Candidatus Chromulinivorax destructor]|nr:A/G-specific adenine glycosylase [Candidatus Chromulinivorax destructor]
MEKLTLDQVSQFQSLIYDYYAANRRDFIWRQDVTPYRIVISEVMLQQTQTARVVPKFENWLQKFPDFLTLAQASTYDVLTAWQGLGYNRRGLALLKIAQIVVDEYNGQLPNDPVVLQTFPAIGPNTAGSICAFAFNNPIMFIETNIRTVYTHTFFQGQSEISDKQLLPLIAQTIDQNNAREWYYALMDYGVHLKQNLPRINAASKHYTKQSKFEGSKRQVRGAIIKILTELKQVDQATLVELLDFQLPENKHDRYKIIQDLIDEKVIYNQRGVISL